MRIPFSFLVEMALKTTLILAAALAVARMLRQSSAAARHGLWIAAIASVLSLPLVSFLTPQWTTGTPVVGVQAEAPSPFSPAAPFIPQPPRAQVQVLAWTWFAGSALVLSRLAAGLLKTARLTRSATPMTASELPMELARQLRLGRRVNLMASEECAIPMTWGVFHPRVLLPATSSNWPNERLRAVLSHEFVHVKRLDSLTQLLSQIACAMYWWNPLVWLASVKLRQERERSCDDAVLLLGMNAPSYAEHLVGLARLVSSGQTRWSSGVAMAGSSNLEDRLVALLDQTRNRRPLSRRAITIAVTAAVCLLLPVAAFRLAAQTAKGTISGTVHDSSGAAIPGATVLAANLDTKTKEIATANAVGEYQFRNVPAGQYALDVRVPGFAVFHRAGLTLTPDAPLTVDPVLAIGGVSEKLVVIGTSPNRSQPPSAVASGAPRRVRIGGNVQATKIISQVKPIYPEHAQRQGIQGTVLLNAVISTDGSLLSVTVVNTLADPELAAAAVDAVRQWRYQPTLLNGVPVEVFTTISVDFLLEK